MHSLDFVFEQFVDQSMLFDRRQSLERGVRDRYRIERSATPCNTFSVNSLFSMIFRVKLTGNILYVDFSTLELTGELVEE